MTWPGAQLNNPVRGIMFLGDSQTHGNSWVTTLGSSLGETTYNEAQSGGKVGWALGFDKAPTDGTTPSTLMVALEQWSRHKARLYVIWYGINDASENYLGAEVSEAVREQTFRERLTLVCRICTDRGGKVALLATQQYPATLTDYVSRNDKTDRYDAIKVEIAAAMANVFYIDETGYLLDDDEFLGADDLHFDTPGDTRQAAAVETGLTAKGLTL